ncbi:tRNA lysidine(34) synthetase TilS [Hwanghaeella grinnelliae]|uniref:tRNA(Ile)-lysidine synthase n=1 Tax=Hwanghaeella grinnelliae TaxID=2500179 RepID=A0A437QGV2_9PROT|nr:tRNA lysidine(34) synthetase TilS [Hwanghaeella grinnelliae]RVU33785.1 tRNA lysidine(34) synthetase TilS [Hwanghaeella grinnelliae]
MRKPAKSAVPDPGAQGPRRSGDDVTPRWFADAMSACLQDAAVSGETADAVPEATLRLAVGCSGGPDSMALTFMLRNWAAERFVPLTALIVDHGLRPEASEEADRVAGWLGERGVEAVVLRYEGARPRSNVQAQARRMRYDLMRDWCLAQGVSVLAVAHHLEDQAETFLLRLARGSGVDGLSAMAPVTEVPGDPYRAVSLIRPLLDTPRGDVHTVLDQSGWPYVDDPSNRNIRHARVRMRNLADILAMEGLDAKRLAGTAKAMRRARAALESATNGFLDAHAFADPHGFAGLERQAYVDLDDELSLRVLTCLLRFVSGGDYPVRLERLEKLATALRGEPTPGPRTLGGCRIETRGERILVCREAAAIGPAIPAQPSILWDRRFRLDLRGDIEGLTVGKLGVDGVRQARALGLTANRIEDLPGAARAALPSLWRNDRLIALADPAGEAWAGSGAGFRRVEFAGSAAWRRLCPSMSSPEE